ncbi:hypothetical protein ACR1PO_15580 [Chryseobacterium sp. RRHN12]|uniref:hypothetical protein n=1 Tax=Chryseobacterium sp. RRHN12 TaxID=3437884 RepID=UPI003D9B30AB
MKNSKYIKVSIYERLPKYGWAVVENGCGEILTVLFNPNTNVKKFKSNYIFFLEEVPDYEDEMKEVLLQFVGCHTCGHTIPDWLNDKAEELLTKLKTES